MVAQETGSEETQIVLFNINCEPVIDQLEHTPNPLSLTSTQWWPEVESALACSELLFIMKRVLIRLERGADHILYLKSRMQQHLLFVQSVSLRLQFINNNNLPLIIILIRVGLSVRMISETCLSSPFPATTASTYKLSLQSPISSTPRKCCDNHHQLLVSW